MTAMLLLKNLKWARLYDIDSPKREIIKILDKNISRR